MVTAVTLDFWNTLIDDYRFAERRELRATRLAAALAPHGYEGGADPIDDAFAASWDHFERVWRHERRTPTTAESMDVILAALEVTVPDDVRDELTRMMEELLLETPPRPVVGVPETLPLLAQRYALAVVCDAGLSPGRTLRKVLELHGLAAHFRFLFFSDEHGVSKPDPRAFALTLDELGVQPTQAVHVGDIQRTDVAGAHGAGMRAVLFAGVSAADVEVSTAEAVVYWFPDLPATLKRLG